MPNGRDARKPEREELEAAWAQIADQIDRLAEDRPLAELAIQVIRVLGNATRHLVALRQIAVSWSREPDLVLGATSLLLEQAARRGMDEPVGEDDHPAAVAALCLEQCLEASAGPERGPLNASLGNALRFCGPRRDADAQAAFGRALELDRGRGDWWQDLAVLHKWRGRFEEALRATQEARTCLGETRGTLWNIAICATAIGDGATACDAWNRLGIPAQPDPATTMPVVEGLPPLMIRVLSRGSATDGTSAWPERAVGFELVWIAPLSPCHGVVQSPTFRDAPIDYGDLILWDGAPVASHIREGREPIPVFPVLEVLRQGAERRWPFVGIERVPGAVGDFEARLPKGTRLFLRAEHVEHHCPACASAETHVGHPDDSTLVRGKLIVPANQELQPFQQVWETALKQARFVASVPGLYEELGNTKRAGQEHQAWRGIERKGRRTLQ